MATTQTRHGGNEMTMWEYYKDKIKHKDPLDAFYNDAMEFRESVVYTYDILNRKTPVAGTVHAWNAARSAMSMEMDDFDKAFFKFMKKKTEKNAELFDKAWMAMIKPLQMARNAIFASKCRRHWNKNKGTYKEWRLEDK